METVKFDPNGGYGGPGFYALRVDSVIDGITDKQPLLGGYTFTGWYDNPDGKGDPVLGVNDDTFTVQEESVTLYAG